MGKTTIAWTHYSWNPWWGCTKVSTGCANCYAEAWDKRTGGSHWGKSERRFFGEKHWREPLKWNEAARKAGERRRVFCASMADVFEDAPGLDEQRRKLWLLIHKTENLDWLLLTKRPENIERMYLDCYPWGSDPAPNVWLGTSVEDQDSASERIPHLLKVPARVRFLSVEPLLRIVDLAVAGAFVTNGVALRASRDSGDGVSWVIVGGESGPRARPCDVAWIRSIVEQCKAANVPCFVKQLGSKPIEMVPRCGMPSLISGLLQDCGFQPDPGAVRDMEIACARVDLRDSKGADPAEWPEDLRVQEFPT